MSALKICPQCGTEYELDQRFCPKDGSTLKSQGTTADLVGAIIADRYHVLKKLGEGGMGTVYLAEHVKMGRKSAVKVMNPAMVHDADAISRFNREAANASKIGHPNVAAVYDFGETSDGMIYLAMEFVEGPALTRVIEQAGALPPIRAADITRQAAEALAVAHDMGIVHRDLKPDNIMLAKNRDGSDLVKVVDFGIAKAANNDAQKVTKTGLVVGTPEYMSPEQLAGDKLDGRSDIYSLALVAFAMMTGKLPFPGETVQESMIARLTDEPKRLHEMKPDVNWPPAVQAVMDKALQRDADLRYASASEFGRDLYTAVSTMPDSAATSAFTAVMGRLSTPAKPNPLVGEAPKGTKAIPATRVNKQSTPRDVPALAPPSPKAKRMAIGGMVVFVTMAAGLWAAGKFGSAATATRPDSLHSSAGQVATQGGQTAPAATPPINLARELEAIDVLATDTTPATAREALNRLAPLDSLARASDDHTLLYFRFIRGKALLNSGDIRTGCDSLYALEGRLSRSETLRRTGQFLIDICRQR